jgi:plastocyanin
MSHKLRLVATCAVAFGMMAIVGSAARQTDASAGSSTTIPAVEATLPLQGQVIVTPEPPVLPESLPSGEIASATEVIPVDIKGFVYMPDPVTVPAGASVAWTNLDNAPHTSTGIGDAILALDSGAIVFGQTFTQQFDTPGTYPYYCVYHPNMLGTVIVTP